MTDNESNSFGSRLDRDRFLRVVRESLPEDELSLDEIEQEIQQRNPEIIRKLVELIGNIKDPKEKAVNWRVGLLLLHLVYAQGDLEEFEHNFTIVDGGDEDLPPSA